MTEIVTVTKTSCVGESWWRLYIVITAGEQSIYTKTLNGETTAEAQAYQALIDGGDPPFSAPGIGYAAASDQVKFYTKGTVKAISRMQVAPQLASALELRQPMDLNMKPAKG